MEAVCVFLHILPHNACSDRAPIATTHHCHSVRASCGVVCGGVCGVCAWSGVCGVCACGGGGGVCGECAISAIVRGVIATVHGETAKTAGDGVADGGGGEKRLRKRRSREGLMREGGELQLL